uniref:Uncharacterized protein n=1 Tax=Clytia hemisphaerica TaxID=252671 RepID=A0A7M5XLT4_9CNID
MKLTILKHYMIIYFLAKLKIIESTLDRINKQARFLDVKEHRRVAVKNKYAHLRGLTEVQCVGHCTLTDDCHSVNHHGDDQICVVIDEPLEGVGDSHLVDSRGWRYFKKTVLKPEETIIQRKSNFEIKDAFKPERNRLINIIPVQTKEWQMSLEFIVYGQYDERFTDILRCSASGTLYQPVEGSKLPVILFHSDKKLRLIVWNKNKIEKNYGCNFNEWYKVDIRMERVMANNYILQMFIDDNEVKRKIQKNPKTFTNVECYAGGKDKMTINGQVMNLKYNQSNKDFDGSLSDFKLTTNNVIETIPRWPKEWFVKVKMIVHSIP